MNMVPLCICLLVLLNGVFCGDVLRPLKPLPNALTLEQISKTAKILHSMPELHEVYKDIENFKDLFSMKCYASLNTYLQNLNSPWAIKMIDASSKIPDGIMSGTYTHLGNFDQCLSVKAKNEAGEIVFTGQHCEINYNIGVALNLAGCVPSTCTPQDMESILNRTLGSLLGIINVGINPLNCYIENDTIPYDASFWVIVSIFIVLGVVLCAGTIFDLFLSQKCKNLGKAGEALKTFSVPRNLKFLSGIEHARGSITCLHGIRVFSLLWIMFGHQFSSDGGKPMINIIEYLLTTQESYSSLVHSAILGVDTFFFLSGFLVCYVCLQEKNRGNKFNIFIYYLNRYLRLSTSYALIIGFYAAFSYYIGYGPKWRPLAYYKNAACRKNWWPALLYINNYYNDLEIGQCIGHSWYLTVDMQLSFLAPIVLIPLLKWPKWTMISMPILVLASCFAPFTWTFIKEGPLNYATCQLKPALILEYLFEMYMATHMRVTPYIVGIAFAYFMSKDLSKFKIPLWVTLMNWIASTAIALTIVFYPSTAFKIDLDTLQFVYEYNVVGASYFAGFHRLAWSLILCWIIFACVHGYSGPVNRILSWRMLLLISRLSYCIYLWHFLFIDYFTSTVKTLSYFSYFTTLSSVIFVFVYSIPLSMVMYLACEAPTLGLLKIFIKSLAGKKKSSDDKKQLDVKTKEAP